MPSCWGGLDINLINQSIVQTDLPNPESSIWYNCKCLNVPLPHISNNGITQNMELSHHRSPKHSVSCRHYFHLVQILLHSFPKPCDSPLPPICYGVKLVPFAQLFQRELKMAQREDVMVSTFSAFRRSQGCETSSSPFGRQCKASGLDWSVVYTGSWTLAQQSCTSDSITGYGPQRS